MRKLPLLAFLLALAGFVPLAEASKYSVRDAGFVEVEVKPFQLVLLAKNPAAPDAKKQRSALNEDLRNSNIVLVQFPTDPKNAPGVFKSIDIPAQLTAPVFWLIAPDDRVVPFDPTASMNDLLKSEMRQAIDVAITNSLCTVLLLESTNDEANQTARAKIQTVLDWVNQNRKRLGNIPDAEVKLLTLTVEKRKSERWTLWGLGEDVTAGDAPKVAVLYGKMRRTGSLLERDWAESDLLRRIAALGQPLGFSVPPDFALPFRWGKDWPDKAVKALRFNPASDAVKVEMKDVKQKLPGDDVAKKDRERKFEELITSFTDFLWHDPNPGPGLQPAQKAREASAPSIFASMDMAIALLVVGVIGWIALGTGAFVLERRAPADPSLKR